MFGPDLVTLVKIHTHTHRLRHCLCCMCEWKLWIEAETHFFLKKTDLLNMLCSCTVQMPVIHWHSRLVTQYQGGGLGGHVYFYMWGLLGDWDPHSGIQSHLISGHFTNKQHLITNETTETIKIILGLTGNVNVWLPRAIFVSSSFKWEAWRALSERKSRAGFSVEFIWLQKPTSSNAHVAFYLRGLSSTVNPAPPSKVSHQACCTTPSPGSASSANVT